jgi:hypothetical protein
MRVFLTSRNRTRQDAVRSSSRSARVFVSRAKARNISRHLGPPRGRSNQKHKQLKARSATLLVCSARERFDAHGDELANVDNDADEQMVHFAFFATGGISGLRKIEELCDVEPASSRANAAVLFHRGDIEGINRPVIVRTRQPTFNSSR